MIIRKIGLIAISLLGLLQFCSASSKDNKNLLRADQTLGLIFKYYDSGNAHLFNETYPYREENKVSYLAGEDNVKGKRVAYLWPTSGIFSGVNALLKTTNEQKYAAMLDNVILPGLQNYYDNTRKPACYQSYIAKAGESDRFYDDNVWLALDFCESYVLTGQKEYLQKSIETWQFVISGWDNQLGGGIYWCEQKKHSKNTCSNAPGSVLAFKLFEATKDSNYFNWGKKIYDWTKTNLQDSTDGLYFDNKRLDGKIGRAKFTYNSGQMLQAAALRYKLTGEKVYLDDAQKIANSVIDHFTEDFETPDGKNIRLFKNSGNWFNAILFRGYVELYHLDHNPKYINVFRDNMEFLWNNGRDEKGLFSKDWTGKSPDEYKWLLDQASLVEILAVLAEMEH